jgi:hypothetical protein
MDLPLLSEELDTILARRLGQQSRGFPGLGLAGKFLVDSGCSKPGSAWSS